MDPRRANDPAPALPRPFGRYVLAREIGRGAMGVVYEARDESLGRSVALKTLASGRLAGADELRRFRDEARAAARLAHPGIVKVLDVGEVEGLSYFTMELVPGPSLAELLEAGPLEPRRAAALVAEVADAIEHAHQSGVVHRDLKPRNVLLDAEGRPRVTDFGLAKAQDTDSSLTGSGEALGTPAYMAPEQAAGREVGPQADVYGLGALLYSALAARPLFLSPTAVGTLKLVEEREPIRLRVLEPRVPRDLETICHAALHKLPGRRPPGAAALAADLRRFLAGEPIVARPVGPLERLVLRMRLRPAVSALAAALLLLALVAGAVIAWQLRVGQVASAALARAGAERTQAFVARVLESRAETLPQLAAALDAQPDTAARADSVRALDAIARDGEADAARRLRARLALAGSVPEHLAAVPSELARLDHDPLELALAAGALRAARARVAPEAFQALLEAARAAPAGERLSALALVCALAPEDPGLEGGCAELALALARADPYLLPAWHEALAPYPRPLLEALAELALTGDADERLQAARVLARQPARAAALCAALLPRGDERLARALLPALRAEVEVAVPILEAALARRAAPRWGELPRALPEPEPRARALLEAAGGRLAASHALAPDLSPDELLLLVELLNPAGYRPTRARPWTRAEELRLAAVWTRDGADFELAFDLGPAELEAARLAALERGLFPRDLSGWHDGAEPRHLAVFAPLPAGARDALFASGELDARLAVDPRFGARVDELGALGYRVDGVDLLPSPGAPPRILTTWLRVERAQEFFFPAALTAAALALDPYVDLCALDLASWVAPGGEQRLAGAFAPEADRESRAIPPCPPEEHAARAAALEAAGFRPAALCAAAPDGAPRVASVWQRPIPPVEERLARSRERARAAIGLACLGRLEAALPLLRAEDDLDARSRFVVECGPAGVDPRSLCAALEAEPDPRGRRALAAALGGALFEARDVEALGRCVALLARLHRETSDAGLRAACAWSLRRLGTPPESSAPPEGASWRVREDGLTMVRVDGPRVFRMGAPGWEPGREASEVPHRRRVPRSFELSATELTMAQLRPFFEEHPEHSPGFGAPDDTPPLSITWYQAAAYCRWLSEREGLPEAQMCYPPLDAIGPGMLVPDDAPERLGWRLPTEAEWELCCRAGSGASYGFGDDPSLLPAFAHCREVSLGAPGPVARHRPNELGFFDLHGNVLEWCHEPEAVYWIDESGRPVDDVPVPELVLRGGRRILRGGTFDELPGVLRSASRKRATPDTLARGLGFRLARTLE